jgi:hypothetical protein
VKVAREPIIETICHPTTHKPILRRIYAGNSKTPMLEDRHSLIQSGDLASIGPAGRAGGNALMRCSKCGAENREGRKFCAKCAAPLSRTCPKCGAANEPGEDFCGDCATPLGQPSAASVKKSNNALIRVTETSVPESLDGERKTVTALFADIKGSMELMEDLDPEEARAVVDPALKLMMDAVHRYGGYVAQSTGDGIFALFGAPVAYEECLQPHFENSRESKTVRWLKMRHRQSDGMRRQR